MATKPPVPVEIRTAICIRPLLKKERDESVVLEAQTTSGEKTRGVALHPLPPKINGETIAPSHALILQTMSPDTIQTGHDEEFRFDHVFATHPYQIVNPVTSTTPQYVQDQVYTQIGRPMALRSMEPIVANGNPTALPSSHLILAMGNQASGKSHICWGPGSIGKRKTAQDGIVLRMVDSLFSQFDRLKTKSKLAQKQHYALNLSFLQICQDAYRNSHDSCEVHDILQEGQSFSFGARLLFASRVKSGKHSGAPKSNSSIASSELSEESVILEQDPDTADFHVVNQSTHTCHSMQEARDSISNALTNAGKLKGKRRFQCHILVQMQPVLLEKRKPSARVLKKGGIIAVLDMAAVDEIERKCNRRHRAGASLLNRSDAHTALIHCLRSIQYNEEIRMGKAPLMDSLEDAEDDDAQTKMSEITCSVVTEPKVALQRQPSFKKVPYPRHKLTMLLQPLFSSTFTEKTYVTILLAASPGESDYKDKKGLMQELESFVSAHTAPAKTVMTGLVTPNALSESIFQKNAKLFFLNREKEVKMSISPPCPKQDVYKISAPLRVEAEDEAESITDTAHPRGLLPAASQKKVILEVSCDRKKQRMERAPMFRSSSSMTYSDTSDECDDVSRPPPMAPPPVSKPFFRARYVKSPNASAPRESDVYESGRESSTIRVETDHEYENEEDDSLAPKGPAVQSTTSNDEDKIIPEPPVEMFTSIKNAVKVGKKKCGKVLGKMYGAGVGSSEKVEELQSSETENLRSKLAASEAECKTLRIRNKELLAKYRTTEEERNNFKTQLEILESKLGIRKENLSDTCDNEEEFGLLSLDFRNPMVSETTPSSVWGSARPSSPDFADFSRPRLPFGDNRTYTEQTTTATTATTTRPLPLRSLKAKMAKLSSHKPVSSSPTASPWDKYANQRY